MARTDRLRKQHVELVKVVEILSGYLNEANIAQDAAGARTAMSELAGKLGVHLSMEDKVLYPEMIKCADPKTKATAEKFVLEMGDIATAFTAYNGKWTIPFIGADPASFIKETKGIFEVLSKRIAREEGELYPLADQL